MSKVIPEVRLADLEKALAPIIQNCLDNLVYPAKGIVCKAGTNPDVEYYLDYKKYKYDQTLSALVEIPQWTMTPATNLYVHRSTYTEFVAILENLASGKKFPLIFINAPKMKFTAIDDDGMNHITLGQVIIATYSPNPNATADVRLVQTITPILRPTYDMFMHFLDRAGYLEARGQVREHLFYGKEGENGYTGQIFASYVDAIEINDLKIKLKTC